MLVMLDGTTKGFGENIVLKNIKVAVNEKDRIGLIGLNGIGKSTLLNMICGVLEPDEGTVSVKQGLSIGYLRQNSGLSSQNTVEQEMRLAFEPLLKAQEQMKQLEHQMGQLPVESVEYRTLSAQYAKLSSYFEVNEGYQMEVKIKSILQGMGFAGTPMDTVIDTLSGGEKTRLAMAKLLLQQPELLILDEPTNHLDFGTLMWLEEYLNGYQGALIIVSHDRYFLDKTVQKIWEIERGELFSYKGNYSAYKVQKKEKMIAWEREYEKQMVQIASLTDYVERNMARASTASRAKSKLHALERMEIIQKPVQDKRETRFSFTFEKNPVNDVLKVSHLILEVGNPPKKLCGEINFEVKRGRKVALIGANGTGKSTLLKCILGLLPVSHGEIHIGGNVNIGFFEQEARTLNGENTVLDELWNRFPHLLEHQARGLLGQMMFTGDDVYKKVKELSGGERAKLYFAILMAGHHNVLVLDEPTNHLDLQSREALEEALIAYEGTLLFVSHDRYFVNAVSTDIGEIENESFAFYVGDFDQYAKRQQERQKQAQERSETAKKTKGNYRGKKQRSETVRRQNQLAALERELEECQKEEQQLTDELADPEVAADYQLVAQKCARLEELKSQMDALMEQWMELEEDV